jgi:CYTH domain-containing protein
VEIERKFELARRPPALEQHPHERIEQGYLAIDPAGTEVRIRRMGDDLTLTVKAGGGLVRAEEALVLQPAEFDALWPLTLDRRIVKTRYMIPFAGGLTVEVDVYEEALAGLVIAEVEFPDEPASRAFAPPDWLGREVTGDPRYANRSLAVAGRPPAS